MYYLLGSIDTFYSMNSMKRQNDRILKEELPRSVSAQYATGDQWRNNSRKSGAFEARRGTLWFLPQLVMRPSSIAPNPVEFREAPPNSTVTLTSQRHAEKLPEVTGTSRWNPGFPAATQERPRESVFKTFSGPIPLP